MEHEGVPYQRQSSLNRERESARTPIVNNFFMLQQPPESNDLHEKRPSASPSTISTSRRRRDSNSIFPLTGNVDSLSDCVKYSFLFVIIVTMFGIFWFSITVAKISEQGVTDLPGEKDKDQSRQDGPCSANSFMIGDRVCDEITNTKRCLYDGKDCCLEDKSTPYCKVCTCKLDTSQLSRQLTTTGSNVVNFRLDKLLTARIKTGPFTTLTLVKDVQSSEVCSILCNDEDLTKVEDVNAWMFNASDSRCSCLKVNPICQAKHHVLELNDTSCPSLYIKMDSMNQTLACEEKYNLLVTAGTTQQKATEIIVINRDSKNHLLDLNPYPGQINWATGGLLNNEIPLICGGETAGSEVEYLKDCYVIGKPEVQAKMKVARALASSIVLTMHGSKSLSVGQEVLFVVGGMNEVHDALKSTEFVGLDPRRTVSVGLPGPELPLDQGVANHCMTKVNGTTAILVGGNTMPNKSLWYSIEDSSWTQGPGLPSPKSGFHACGFVMDQALSIPLVIVVGRFSQNVDIFNVSEETWRTSGPGWRGSILGSQLVNHPQGSWLIHIDFMDGPIRRLDCRDLQCDWTTLEESGTTGNRYYFVAMLVPDFLPTLLL